MQIRLIEDHHLQFGPVTVALAGHRILALVCRLAASRDDVGESKSAGSRDH